MNKILKISLMLFILLITSSCGKKTKIVLRQDYFGYLDTVGYVIVEYESYKYNEKEVKDILTKIKDILLEIECQFSISQTPFMKNNDIGESTLMKINRLSGKQPVRVNDDFLELITTALTYAEATKGAFDPTVGALSTLWNISSKAQYCMEPSDLMEDICTIPSDEEIQEVLPLIDYQLLEVDYELKEVFLTTEGAKLDLGAVGKGYAVEKIKKYLKEFYFSYTVINIGGNVAISGTPSEEQSISVANPFGPGVLGYYYPKENTGGVTSGTYERYITYKDVKYHHILDPKTGYPVKTDIVSVTIMGENSCVADALSTSIFMLGVDEGIKYINQLEGYETIIITEDQQVYLSNKIDFVLEEKLQIIK